MTTYSSAITLTETELWAVEAAMKFYVTPDAKKLREANPELQPWYLHAEIKLKEMLDSEVLREGLFMSSTSSSCWRKPE